MQAGTKTEKSIEVYRTIGERRDKMLENNAQRIDELLNKSRIRRQKVEKQIKSTLDDKIYFASMKADLL